MMPEQGDILLIPVPFTDLSSKKKRPVVVISNNQYNQSSKDILVAAITSNPIQVNYSIQVRSFDLIEGKLKRPSKIRVDKIYSLSQGIAIRKFGKISTEKLNQIKDSLFELITEKNDQV